MSYNGSGLFQINTSGQPVVAGTVITASAFNALTADLATGLTTAITKDGQTATTAQIPFAAGLRSTLTTDSTTSTSGSIITDGGLGVAKAITAGSTITGTKLIPTGTSVTGNGMYLPAANTLGFSTNGTNAVTIDSSQNVGVGVTPSAWSLGKAIELNSLGSGLWSSGARNIRLANNVIYTGGAYKYATTGFASLLTMGDDSTLTFAQAASGTAGNTITFTQAMTLDSSGALLVGNSSVGSSNNGWKVTPNSGGRTGYTNTLASSAETTNTYSCHDMYSSAAGAYRFFVGWGGTIYATNTTISSVSDIRYKENVRDLDVGLDAVMALKPRLYDWKEGKGADIKNARGFIAQEFEEVFPDLIDEWRDPAPEGEEPYKSVRQDLIPVLVKAIQEQQALITTLTERITALENA